MSNITLIKLPHACQAATEIKEGGSTRPADIMPILEKLIEQDRALVERIRQMNKVKADSPFPLKRN